MVALSGVGGCQRQWPDAGRVGRASTRPLSHAGLHKCLARLELTERGNRLMLCLQPKKLGNSSDLLWVEGAETPFLGSPLDLLHAHLALD